MFFKKARFSNINPNIKPKNFLDLVKWKINSKSLIWPKQVKLEAFDVPPTLVEGNEIRVSYVGHVTFLIQTCGLNILTDPVWSERASPLKWAGPKRVIAPGIELNKLPKIDLILISHNHYDHMDINIIKFLVKRDNPQIITPLVNDVILKKHITNIEVITLNWFQNTNFKNIKISLKPSQHWSARSLFDKNIALWGTFVITTERGSICFIGDTGYDNKIFKDIGNNYNILLSLIPIGAYEPRWFMRDVHINPEEAVYIHQDLNSQYSIASHFNTFPLADDNYNQAPQDLALALDKHNIDKDKFITPIAGKYYIF